jgi:mannose-1-phosphate guanylyltransferase
VATLALSKGYQVRVGVADLQGNRVVGWREKPDLDICVGIGVLVLRSSIMQALEQLSGTVPELDLMSHLIPHLIAQHRPVGAYPTDAFWYDVGSAERYEKLDNGSIETHLKPLF